MRISPGSSLTMFLQCYLLLWPFKSTDAGAVQLFLHLLSSVLFNVNWISGFNRHMLHKDFFGFSFAFVSFYYLLVLFNGLPENNILLAEFFL